MTTQREADAAEPAWSSRVKELGELSMQIDESTPASTRAVDPASLWELGQQLEPVLTALGPLEDSLAATEAGLGSHEAEWRDLRSDLGPALQETRRTMGALAQLRLTDLGGGFERFFDELMRAMQEHDCGFRARPAALRAQFRQIHEAMMRCALDGAWRTVCEVNADLGAMAAPVAKPEGVTAELVGRVEHGVVEYARSLEAQVQQLTAQLEETDERGRALRSQMHNLERYNKNLHEMAASGRYDKGDEPRASLEELKAELSELRAKSATLRSILESKCECSRVQQ